MEIEITAKLECNETPRTRISYPGEALPIDPGRISIQRKIPQDNV